MMKMSTAGMNARPACGGWTLTSFHLPTLLPLLCDHIAVALLGKAHTCFVCLFFFSNLVSHYNVKRKENTSG